MRRKLKIVQSACALVSKRAAKKAFKCAVPFARVDGTDVGLGSVVETESGVGYVTSVPRSIEPGASHRVVVTVPKWTGEKDVVCEVKAFAACEDGVLKARVDGFKPL